MKKRILALVLIMACLLAGCQQSKKEDLMKGIQPQGLNVPPVEGPFMTNFAVELFQNCQEEGENTLISPLSVMYALAMTANGADGQTLAQMEQVLGMDMESLNVLLYSYQKDLPQGDKYKLHLANSIWFRDTAGFEVKKDFLQCNADYYGAGIFKAPFDHTTLYEINGWVEENTDGMIPEVLSEIPEELMMCLINALAFDAEWENIYEDIQVREGIFTKEDGTEQTVDMMYGTEGEYLEDEKATGFIRYYKDRKYAFVALLPNEGISVSEYVATMDAKVLNEMLADPVDITVYSGIPKFETEYDLELNDALKAMGMTDAFDGTVAGFSGISDTPLMIDQVIHKTYISVDERGTKAGAVTAVMMDGGSAFPIESKTVTLDRPFVYMLIDCQTNTPFFIGTMMDVNG